MHLQQLELRRIALDLVTPFRTSFGTQTRRDILLLRVATDRGDGWGECVAMAEPVYEAVLARSFPASDIRESLARAAGQGNAKAMFWLEKIDMHCG